jgi:hypothetical protein
MRRTPHRLGDWARRSEGAIYLAAALLSAGLTAVALQLWQATWSVPFEYATKDATLISAHFKTVGETGWFEVQPLLGAPGKQIYFDWFVADNLHFMWADVLDFIFRNPFVAENVYYVIGFPLAALSATYFLRVVGVSKVMSVVLAGLFAIAPYHFIRGEHHLWFSSYYCVPLALVIVYRALDGQALWGRRPDSGRVHGLLGGRGMITAVSIVVSATASTYYSFFAVLLLASAGLIAVIRTRAWRRFWGAAIAGAAVVVVMVINLLPALVYAAVNGSNAQAVVRTPLASYIYALRLSDLLLPMPHDRIPLLATLRSEYESIFGGAEEPALGLVAAIGMLVAIGIVVYNVTRRVRPPLVTIEDDETGFSPRTALANLSSLAIIAFVIATAGGFSLLVAIFTSNLRAWDRMSILIALFCLGIVGVLLDLAIARYTPFDERPIRSRAAVATILAVVILCVGFFDQTAPDVAVPPYAENVSRFTADQKLVSTIQSSVPPGSRILQLPYQRFPETAPLNGVDVSDQLMPYLHSSTLKWSGGGIKGRALVEWQTELGKLPAERLAASASCADFAGVLLDMHAYGDKAGTTAIAMNEALGSPSAIADNGRYRFYTFQKVVASVSKVMTPSECRTVGDLTTRAVYAFFAPDVYADGFALLPSIVDSYRPNITLQNPTSRPVRLDLSFDLTYAHGSALVITPPGGRSTTVPTSGDPGHVSMTVTAPPGTSMVSIAPQAGESFSNTDGLDSVLTVRNVEAVNPKLTSLVARIPAG